MHLSRLNLLFRYPEQDNPLCIYTEHWIFRPDFFRISPANVRLTGAKQSGYAKNSINAILPSFSRTPPYN